MANLISPETYISIKSLSKEYRITNSSNIPKKNKKILRCQISEMLKKGPCEENPEMHERIINWIEGLLLPQILNVFSTYNPLICNFLIQMNLKIISDGDFEFALVENSEKKFQEDSDIKKIFYSRKRNHKRRDEKTMAEKELELGLRFLDTEEYIDTLSLEINLLKNSGHLFKLLNIISGNKAFRIPCRAYWDNSLKKWMHEYPSWHRPSTFHSLTELACASIEREVWIKFWEINSLDPRYPDDPTSYSPQNTILSSVDALITLPPFFRLIDKEQKIELIGDIASLTKTFQEVRQKLSEVGPRSNVPTLSSNAR